LPTLASAEEFLAELPSLERACLLLDVRMPGTDGLELLGDLVRRGHGDWPTVIMTGHADIPAAVQAMRLGAIEFLEKPFSDEDLISALERGYQAILRSQERHERQRAAQACLQLLSDREKFVLDRLRAGKSNKQIAAEAGLSHRTVEIHRGNLMRKLNASRLVDALNLLSFAEDQGSAAPQ